MTNCFRNLLTFFFVMFVYNLSSLIRDGSNIKNLTFEPLELLHCRTFLNFIFVYERISKWTQSFISFNEIHRMQISVDINRWICIKLNIVIP